MRRRLVFLGPPASGKGTFTSLIGARHGIPATSTGAMFRHERELGTPTGLAVHELTSKGKFAPDEVVIELALKWVSDHMGAFLFDGFPRTLPQGVALGEFLERHDNRLDGAVLLDLPYEDIRSRVLARRVCSACRMNVSMGVHVQSENDPCPRCGGRLEQRPDDSLDVLDKRMQLYRENTMPLVPFYEQRDLLLHVDARGGPAVVLERLEKALDAPLVEPGVKSHSS